MSDWQTQQLERLKESGVLDRLHEAVATRAEVVVPRSDGTTSTGWLDHVFQGSVHVQFFSGGKVKGKLVRFSDFLRANPEFGPDLYELVPPEERWR